MHLVKAGDDEPHDGARPPRGAPQPGGRALRFALIVLGACVVSGGTAAGLMSYVVHGLLTLGTINGPAVPTRATAVAVAGRPAAAKSAADANSKVSNLLTYAADGNGHFFVDASVNGAPVRFLVDTGATFVALSPDDAAAAGISTANLQFTEAMTTANGVAHAARTTLRSLRLGQLDVADVAAAVMDQPMPFSLLGMSFLSRVDGYTIRDGVLTIEW